MKLHLQLIDKDMLPKTTIDYSKAKSLSFIISLQGFYQMFCDKIVATETPKSKFEAKFRFPSQFESTGC